MITKLPENAITIAESIPKLPDWKGRSIIYKLRGIKPDELPREMARIAEIGPPYAKLIEALIAESAKDASIPKGSPMNKQTNTVNTL